MISAVVARVSVSVVIATNFTFLSAIQYYPSQRIFSAGTPVFQSKKKKNRTFLPGRHMRGSLEKMNIVYLIGTLIEHRPREERKQTKN